MTSLGLSVCDATAAARVSRHAMQAAVSESHSPVKDVQPRATA